MQFARLNHIKGWRGFNTCQLFLISVSRWQQVQNEAVSRCEHESPSAASVCHKACDSFNCSALAGLLLGLHNNVLSGLGPQMLHQTGPDMHVIKSGESRSKHSRDLEQNLTKASEFRMQFLFLKAYLPLKLLEKYPTLPNGLPFSEVLKPSHLHEGGFHTSRTTRCR